MISISAVTSNILGLDSKIYLRLKEIGVNPPRYGILGGSPLARFPRPLEISLCPSMIMLHGSKCTRVVISSIVVFDYGKLL